MIDELIRQLNDADPATRRRAIIALGKSKDASALRGLANVVKNDPDPELRDLARKAGQYIRRESEKQTQAREDTAPLPNTADLQKKVPPSNKPTPSDASPASRLRLLDDEPAKPAKSRPETTPLPNTSDLVSKTPPKPAGSAPPPPSMGSRLRLLGDEPVKPQPDTSRFQRPTASDDDLPLDLGLDDEPTDAEAEPEDNPYARPRSDMYEPPIDLYDRLATGNRAPEPEPEPSAEPNLALDPDLFGEPPMPGDLPGESEAPVTPKSSLIVKGREYNVTRDDKIRAKQYLDAALSQNMNGDNAKAMKSLTQAISLNPNLINDGFFNNVASTVTGLEADEAAQMVIDRQERKRFTETAAQQQKNQRVEKHLSTAKQATWTDVIWEVVLYSLISILGPIFGALVLSERLNNLFVNFAEVSADLPEGFQEAQTMFATLSVGTLLPRSIVLGLLGVVSLLIQIVLIHFVAMALGGTGTWRHLVQVLLGFYNRWLPILFFLSYLMIVIAFLALFSPIALCAVLVVLVLSIYVTFKTAGIVGEAYDFGVGKGCMALIVSLLVIGLINSAISFIMAQSLGIAFG